MESCDIEIGINKENETTSKNNEQPGIPQQEEQT